MEEETLPLEKNQTWEIIKSLKGKKLVGCKWVSMVKYRVDKTLEKYKARLVTKGYTQTYVVDYHETFTSVAKMNTICILLLLATNFGWNLQQLDIKNTFLYGD